MSPLSTKKKIEIASRVVQRRFPNITPLEKNKVVAITVHQFQPNYSPLKSEQTSRHALGSGASFRDFTIGIARHVTHHEPVGINREKLGDIIRKLLM